ncbi:MAG TPA: SUMF1/EgtB/PvdO family nonheme iron enzyme, partial [Thermoanaerobaculia bacterium]|nr:SUMF1/EgtB/PvdO family nonheme iron enzyme [Thermoanaerobaculia bacterium]
VFLNACETGRTPDGADHDPFAGVATALVLGGVPAVIAMQLPIADEAAITFSRTVYDRLAAGDPVDAAVAEGRQALYAASRDTVEWAIPVLFTRIPDGRIFAPQARTAPEPRIRPVRRGRPRLLAGIAACVVLALLAVFALRSLDTPIHFPGAPEVPPIETARVGGFRIAKTEVTHREYLLFVQAKEDWRKDKIFPARHDGDYLQDWISSTEYPPGLADHPVTHVSWFAARDFCEWVGGSLPSKAQWQVAAHSAEHRFPWGPLSPSEPPPLNFCDLECDRQHRDGTHRPNFRDHFAKTAPVKSFPGGRTPEGVFNLSGNVWEWTLNASGDERVTMGGSYLMTYEECSTNKNGLEEARLCAPDVGFRCVWD